MRQEDKKQSCEVWVRILKSSKNVIQRWRGGLESKNQGSELGNKEARVLLLFRARLIIYSNKSHLAFLGMWFSICEEKNQTRLLYNEAFL